MGAIGSYKEGRHTNTVGAIGFGTIAGRGSMPTGNDASCSSNVPIRAICKWLYAAVLSIAGFILLSMLKLVKFMVFRFTVSQGDKLAECQYPNDSIVF